MPGSGTVKYTTSGKYSLNQIAKAHGMSVHNLINSSLATQTNPGLTTYIAQGNYNLPIPAGVDVLVPGQNWRS